MSPVGVVGVPTLEVLQARLDKTQWEVSLLMAWDSLVKPVFVLWASK